MRGARRGGVEFSGVSGTPGCRDGLLVSPARSLRSEPNVVAGAPDTASHGSQSRLCLRASPAPTCPRASPASVERHQSGEVPVHHRHAGGWQRALGGSLCPIRRPNASDAAPGGLSPAAVRLPACAAFERPRCRAHRDGCVDQRQGLGGAAAGAGAARQLPQHELGAQTLAPSQS